jgi:hypothetical protein
VNDEPVEDESRLHALRDAIGEVIAAAPAEKPARAAVGAK